MAFTLDDVPDQTGKTVIITGASSGTGLAASQQLASKGAHVIMACRNLEKSEPLASDICTKGPGRGTVVRLDTTELDSIDAFATSLSDLGVTRVDGVILNAGIMHVDYKTIASRSTKNPDVESQMFCNVVGHFYLVHVLHDLITASPGCRIVSVSSKGADATGKTDSINYDVFLGKAKDKYSPFWSYVESKLGNQWFAHELQRRFEASGTDAIAVGMHPGFSRTALPGRVNNPFLKWATAAMSFMGMPADGGGLVICAAYVTDLKDKEDVHDVYFGPGGFIEFTGAPIATAKPPPQSKDAEQAKRLWECCEELCAVKSEF